MIIITAAGPRLYRLTVITDDGRRVVRLYHRPANALRRAREIAQGAPVEMDAATRAKLGEQVK